MAIPTMTPQKPPATDNGPAPGMTSSPPNQSPAATSSIGSDAYKSLDATGTSIASDMGVKPVVAVPAPTGGPGNVASQDPTEFMPKPNEVSLRRPGARPGVQEPKMGSTNARPRTPMNPANGFGGSSPRGRKGA
jgi:hypothetical protein